MLQTLGSGPSCFVPKETHKCTQTDERVDLPVDPRASFLPQIEFGTPKTYPVLLNTASSN